MDGRGRAKDNIWIERFWRTIKYDYIYIQPEENGAALYQGIDRQIPSKLYLRSAVDINEQQDGTCLKNGSTTLIIISILDMHYLIRSFLKRRKL